jgi:hypothetical protein
MRNLSTILVPLGSEYHKVEPKNPFPNAVNLGRLIWDVTSKVCVLRFFFIFKFFSLPEWWCFTYTYGV